MAAEKFKHEARPAPKLDLKSGNVCWISFQSVATMATAMCVDLLTEGEYFELQKRSEFDTKSIYGSHFWSMKIAEDILNTTSLGSAFRKPKRLNQELRKKRRVSNQEAEVYVKG